MPSVAELHARTPVSTRRLFVDSLIARSMPRAQGYCDEDHQQMSSRRRAACRDLFSCQLWPDTSLGGRIRWHSLSSCGMTGAILDRRLPAIRWIIREPTMLRQSLLLAPPPHGMRIPSRSPQEDRRRTLLRQPPASPTTIPRQGLAAMMISDGRRAGHPAARARAHAGCRRKWKRSARGTTTQRRP